MNVVVFNLTSKNRFEIRKELILKFIEENPGTGKGKKASRYRYNVETYKEYGIYLKRPTSLNKGFDFTVNIDGLSFKKKRRYSTPSHADIINALINCKENYLNEFSKVMNAINEIYNCTSPNLNNINAYFYDFENQKHPIQIILLSIKWLLIEQDCAYWNYSGRAMFYNKLKEHDLV